MKKSAVVAVLAVGGVAGVGALVSSSVGSESPDSIRLLKDSYPAFSDAQADLGGVDGQRMRAIDAELPKGAASEVSLKTVGQTVSGAPILVAAGPAQACLVVAGTANEPGAYTCAALPSEDRSSDAPILVTFLGANRYRIVGLAGRDVHRLSVVDRSGKTLGSVLPEAGTFALEVGGAPAKLAVETASETRDIQLGAP